MASRSTRTHLRRGRSRDDEGDLRERAADPQNQTADRMGRTADRQDRTADRTDRSNPVRSLHRSIGNQAVQSMAANGRLGSSETGGRDSRSDGAPAPESSRPVSTPSGAVVQRQSEDEDGGDASDQQQQEYQEAAGTVLQGIRQTEFGQRVMEEGKTALQEYWETDSGRVLLPIGGAGALVLMDGPLPMSAPSIPLDQLFPNSDLRGLSVGVNIHGLPTEDASIPYVGDRVGGSVSIDDPVPASVRGWVGERGAAGDQGSGGLDYKFMISFDPVELTRQLSSDE